MRSWISRWFWCSRVNWASTISSSPALTQPLPCMNQEKNYHWVSASIHDRKKYWVEAQPCMIQQKHYHLVSASILDRKKYWIEPQPWMNWFIFQTLSLSLSLGKKYSWLSLNLNLYQGEKSEKISVLLRIFFMSAIHSRLREEKNRQKKAKNGQFLRKKCNFQPQFMTSIHDL